MQFDWSVYPRLQEEVLILPKVLTLNGKPIEFNDVNHPENKEFMDEAVTAWENDNAGGDRGL